MFNPDQMLVTLLQATVAAGASDLHLSVGRPPTARRDGVLVPFEGVTVLTPQDTERIVGQHGSRPAVEPLHQPAEVRAGVRSGVRLHA